MGHMTKVWVAEPKSRGLVSMIWPYKFVSVIQILNALEKGLLDWHFLPLAIVRYLAPLLHCHAMLRTLLSASLLIQ